VVFKTSYLSSKKRERTNQVRLFDFQTYSS
jgi:hypothetical protein